MIEVLLRVEVLDSVQGDGAGEPWTGSAVLLCAPLRDNIHLSWKASLGFQRSLVFLRASLVTLQILLVQNSKYSLVLGKQRQEDCKFEASLGNTAPVRKKQIEAGTGRGRKREGTHPGLWQ